jgi:hypothetical protein
MRYFITSILSCRCLSESAHHYNHGYGYQTRSHITTALPAVTVAAAAAAAAWCISICTISGASISSQSPEI